ncbi:MAG: hypothetical protein L6Q83_14205, partial [Gammaproteobacteria bacterium]|nr:hypothetical protein [Gammaproteobacteria bacterium]
AGGGYRRTVVATVTAPNINASLYTNRIGEDLQVLAAVSLGDTPPAPVELTATSSVPGVVAVTAVETAAGGASAAIANVANTNSRSFWLQGLQAGQSAQVRFSAPGYNDATVAVEVDPSGFVFASWVNDFTTTSLASNTSLTIEAVRLSRDTGAVQDTSYQRVRGGLPAPVLVTVESANPAVGTVTPSPQSFAAGVHSVQVQFDPLTAGSSTLTLQTPAGFDEPNVAGGGYRRTVVATVTAPNINASLYTN